MHCTRSMTMTSNSIHLLTNARRYSTCSNTPSLMLAKKSSPSFLPFFLSLKDKQRQSAKRPKTPNVPAFVILVVDCQTIFGGVHANREAHATQSIPPSLITWKFEPSVMQTLPLLPLVNLNQKTAASTPLLCLLLNLLPLAPL